MNGNCLKERRELKVNTLFKRRVKRLFILHSQELDWTCKHGTRNTKFFYRLTYISDSLIAVFFIARRKQCTSSLGRTVRCDVLRWAVNSVADCVDVFVDTYN